MTHDQERLDEYHERIINKQVSDLIIWLDKSMPHIETYSRMNMSLNVLTGVLVTIAKNVLADDQEEEFIKLIVANLILNFEANRETRN